MVYFNWLKRSIRLVWERFALANERQLAVAIASSPETQIGSHAFLLVELLEIAKQRVNECSVVDQPVESPCVPSELQPEPVQLQVPQESGLNTTAGTDGEVSPAFPDYFDRIERPLIVLCDYIYATLSESTDPAEVDLANRLFKRIGKVFDSVGLEIIASKGAFDINNQQVIDSEPTSKATDHDQIKATLTLGYRRSNHLIRREGVVLYKYVPHASSPQD
jgi:hypothetical protein